MKLFGICLIIIGAIWCAVAFNMKTSVRTDGKTLGSGAYSIHIESQEVHNLALADQRRNHIIGAGITIISGILLLGFGNLTNKTTHAPKARCPFCKKNIDKGTKICPHCGKMQIICEIDTRVKDV